MTCTDMMAALGKEKELIAALNVCLEEELGYIAAQDLVGLEESLPNKQKLLLEIAKNRQGIDMERDPDQEHAQTIGILQQELIELWKKANNFNELSKTLVSSRLNDIERQIAIFLAGLKGTYTRQGKTSGVPARMIKTGV
ncbi:MAG: hypothetical protein RRA35_06780 [Desulfomonilia bacterium]|nr:hypothetical protein [Desulfomonilia bacterium]